MSAKRRLRRVLAAVAATVVLPIAGVVAATAAHAGGGPVVTTNGTICWEKGRSGGKRPTVTVHLSEIAKDPFTVVLDTFDGTAVAPDDYTAIKRLVVRIPAGTDSATVPLNIVADDITEPDEWFLVSLSRPSVGTVGKNPATVIIKDGAQPK